MIGKYSLTFNDSKLEKTFQSYMTQKIRIPLFKKVIISSSMFIIASLIYKLVQEGSDLLNHKNTLLKICFCVLVEIVFVLIYRFKQQYIRYALLFYNHLLVVLYCLMENFTASQKQLYTIGILLYQIANVLFGEFWEAVYQTIVFGTIYIILGFQIDKQIDYSILTMNTTAMVLLICAFYENIKALRSQFQLGKIDNQWEQIFKTTVQDQDYIVFNYDEKHYSFNLRHSCLSQNIGNSQELRVLLRNIKVTKKMNMEQELFNSISLNVERNNIINEQLLIPLINQKQRYIVYSIFYGFDTIILLQFRKYSQVQRNKEYAIEKSYQYKHSQFLQLMIKLVKKFSLNKNAPKMICKLRKFCLYAYLKDIILKEGQLLVSEKFISFIYCNHIIKTLQSLYYNKCLTFENTIDEEVMSSRHMILIVLIEVIEISLSISNYIHFVFEKIVNETFRIQVFCFYQEKQIDSLTKRIQKYFPQFVNIQYQLQYINIDFKSFDSLNSFQYFLNENEAKYKMLSYYD